MNASRLLDRTRRLRAGKDYRPSLETLEDRLPPGDAVLSGLLLGQPAPEARERAADSPREQPADGRRATPDLATIRRDVFCFSRNWNLALV